MISNIHHILCCTRRVCLGERLGVLVCTTNFHNCIRGGKRSTFLAVIYQTKWFKPMHTLIYLMGDLFPATIFLHLFFFLFKSSCRKVSVSFYLCQKAGMILMGAAHWRIITFSRKYNCTSLNFCTSLCKQMTKAEKIQSQRIFSLTRLD